MRRGKPFKPISWQSSLIQTASALFKPMHWVRRYLVNRSAPKVGKNDGFVMPNATSRRLFAALLPLLAAEHAATLYPEARQQNVTHQGFCPNGKGAVFSYRERDLWCVAHHSEQFLIGFPDQTFWTVSPIAED